MSPYASLFLTFPLVLVWSQSVDSSTGFDYQQYISDSVWSSVDSAMYDDGWTYYTWDYGITINDSVEMLLRSDHFQNVSRWGKRRPEFRWKSLHMDCLWKLEVEWESSPKADIDRYNPFVTRWTRDRFHMYHKKTKTHLVIIPPSGQDSEVYFVDGERVILPVFSLRFARLIGVPAEASESALKSLGIKYEPVD